MSGLCHCGMSVVVCVRAEGRWGGGVFVAVHSSLSLLLPFFPFVLVFGVVRAQLCEHARYPRTPLRLSCCLVLSSLLPHCLSSLSAFLVSVEWRGGGSPCVTVLCWHDSDRESVSFVLVFLVVACSSFASSSVASSAVAFGAEDSAVVWVVGSA